MKTLDSMLDDIVNKLHVDNESETQAQEFMQQGPMLRRQESHMTAYTIDIEDEN